MNSLELEKQLDLLYAQSREQKTVSIDDLNWKLHSKVTQDMSIVNGITEKQLHKSTEHLSSMFAQLENSQSEFSLSASLWQQEAQRTVGEVTARQEKFQQAVLETSKRIQEKKEAFILRRQQQEAALRFNIEQILLRTHTEVE